MTVAIKNIKDIPDFEKLSLVDFSYSRIDTYDMCPSKYFYSYVQKEPQGFNAAATLGNIVHDVLEDCIDKDTLLSISKMKDVYQNKIQDYDPHSQLGQDLINVGNQLIEEFYEINQDTKFDVFDKEMKFSFIIGQYIINGYIDRVDIKDSSVHIIDYKTGKREVAAKDVHKNLQLRNICSGSLSHISRKRNNSIFVLSKNK